MFEIKDTLVHLAYREAKLFVRLALHCGLLRLQGNYEKTTSNDTPSPRNDHDMDRRSHVHVTGYVSLEQPATSLVSLSQAN